MDRAEHLEWAKQRALAELDTDPYGGGPTLAVASLTSDLHKHPETAGHGGLELLWRLLAAGFLDDPTETRKHIEGFQ